MAGSRLFSGKPVLREFLINGSITVTVGDFVKVSGTAGEDSMALATAGDRIAGIVADIRTSDGRSPSSNGAGAAFVDTYTTASDNETVAKVKVLVNVSTDCLYTGEASATPGTTTGSNKAGYTFEITDEDTIDESTAHATTAQQLIGFGVDPTDATRILFKINESEFRTSP